MINSHKNIWGIIFTRNDAIISRRIAGETILVPIRGKLADMQNIFAVNAVGDYIWNQIDGRKTLREISDTISSAFDIDKETADADVLEFIQGMMKADLITGDHAP